MPKNFKCSSRFSLNKLEKAGMASNFENILNTVKITTRDKKSWQ